MRVCLLSTEYLSPTTAGGIATYTHNLAHGLAALGHQVDVVTPVERALEDVGRPFAAEDSCEVEAPGLRVMRLAVPRRLRLPAGNRRLGLTLESLPFMAACTRKVLSLEAADGPYDVVESPEWMAPGLQLTWRRPGPLVVRLHTHVRLVRRLNGLPVDLDVRLLSGLERMLMQRASAIAANSASLAAEACRDHGLPADRVDVLPLGIDVARFRPADDDALRRRLGVAPGTPVLLYCGRLEHRKGVDVLVEAFGRAARRHPEAVLVLAGFSTATAAGGRSFLDDLRDRAAVLGVADRIRFLGHVPYDELPALYAGCDAFVAPSRYEPFGMIYLEAMACGRPVVGCRAGGVPEIVDDGATGLLVAPGDAAGLADALDRLLTDRALRERLGSAARGRVVTRFAAGAIAERTANLYRGAVRNHLEHLRGARVGVRHAKL